MKPPTARQGRALPLLVLAALLMVAVVVAGAVSLSPAAAAAVTPPTETTIFTIDAAALGDFALDPPSVQSPAAILVHADSGRVLYERNADKQMRMASTTKIMTAILVLERMDLSAPVTVSAKAAQTSEPKTFLKEGDVLSVEQLLYALMVRSANSAAVALAEACSGSVEEFVAIMNHEAAELGMKATHFVNPNGLDAEGHFSTAADMARVARYAMKNEIFRRLVATKTYSLELPGRTKPLEMTNTNKLLGVVPWVTGMKTGLTPRAKQCFVGSATDNGVSVISVILGQPNSSLCFDESKALLKHGLGQYKHVTLLEAKIPVAETTVSHQPDPVLRLVTAAGVEMDLHRDDQVAASVSLDKSVALPVKAGDVFGSVDFKVDGKIVQSVDLVADRSMTKPTLRSKLGYYWGRFGRLMGGN